MNDVFFIKCVKSKCQAHELLITKGQTNARFAKQLFFNNSKLRIHSLRIDWAINPISDC